jgi:hypothetical protein
MWHPDKLEQNKSEDGFYLVDGEKVDKSKADAMIKDLNEAKEVLKRRRDSSSSCSASVSSSSSSSSSEDSEYYSDIPLAKKHLVDHATAVVVQSESKSIKLAVDAPPAAKRPRHTAVGSKLTGSEKMLKQPAAVVVTSGSQAPPLIPAKTSNPIKEPDSLQRRREKQAAASQSKRELPPLPSFHTTSLPPLPELPPLPSLASAKSKPAVVADAKPAPAKVAPPSPVYP